MTTGALIFAFNNDSIDYVALAAWTAGNIKRHLDIPVALVTDVDPGHAIFDQVITAKKIEGNAKFFPEFHSPKSWYNLNRVDAYDLSPWDQTLVIDADYVVAGNQLKLLFDVDRDFQAHRWAYSVTGEDFFNDNHFGRYHAPMWWATVMCFRRGEVSRMIFDTMRMVRDNWQHYCNLYGVRKGGFRNDFALSIALNIIDGHVEPLSIPWPLVTVSPRNQLRQEGQDHFRVDFQDTSNRSRWIVIREQDFHAMGKQDLGDIVASNC